jgi:hypothetical protein
MSSFSPYLEYFSQRLEGLSCGLFRLEMQNQTSNIASQSILRVTLPSNALVDMHSLAWHFNAKTTGGVALTAGPPATPGTYNRLPDKIESLIQRVEVTVGGVSVAAGANFYNTLVQAKARVDGEKRDLGRNHPLLIAPFNTADNYVEGQGGQNLTLAAAVDEAPFQGGAGGGLNRPTAAPFSVTNWEGFLGTCEPRILDTSLIGDVVIVIYLEQPNLCIAQFGEPTGAGNFPITPGVASPDYQITNSYFTVKCYSLATGVYDAMIAQQLQEAGALEVGFKQYFSFRDTNSGVTRFQVASQSIDRLITAHNRDTAAGADALKPIQRFGTLPKASNGSAPPDTSSVPRALCPLFNHPRNSFKYPGATSASAVQFQYTLNGAMTPQFRATAEDMYLITKQASKKETHVDNIECGLDNWLNDDFVHCVKFTMDAPNSRFIQGLDSRSVSLNAFYNVYGGEANKEVTIFVECTSSLLISEGRQIEIIQ